MEGKPTPRIVAKTIGTYIVWMIFTISQVFLALSIHDLIVSAAILLSTNPWVPRAVDVWSMVVLGIVILATIFVTEAYLSKGTRLGVFWRRVGIVAAIEAIIALVVFGLNFIL